MMTLVSCPTCHHKFTIPEGAMGKRHTCPNCQSLFVAGKSVAESAGAGKAVPSMLSAGAGPGPMPKAGGAGLAIDKTMLGEVDAAPIKYNCPRCKKPLEAPASEAGIKKPCPSCGGRLQVPAAPPKVAAAAAFDPLNKTMLASDENGLQSTAPAPAMPLPAGASASGASAGSATAAPAPAPAKKWKIYALGGAAAAVVALAVLFLMGKNAAAEEQKRFLAEQKAELEKLKADIDQKSALLAKQQELDEKNRKQWQDFVDKQEARQRKLDEERDAERKAAASDSEKLAAQRRAEEKQRLLDEEKKAAAAAQARAEAALKDQIDALKRQVDNANQKQTTIIAQPPPVYPWGYYGGYRPWGW